MIASLVLTCINTLMIALIIHYSPVYLQMLEGEVATSAEKISAELFLVHPRSTLRNIATPLNAKLRLICPLQTIGTSVWEWRKDGEKIKSSHRVTTHYDNLELEILTVVKDDEGNYACIDSDLFVVGTYDVSVAGTIAARVVAPHEGGEDVVAGDDIKLECIFEGSVDAVWYKDGFPLKHSNRQMTLLIVEADHNTARLTIADVQPSDAGNYSCVLTNNVHSNNSYSLRVATSPILLSPALQYISDYAGSTHIVQCKVGGYPSPYVKWYKKNRKEQLVPIEKSAQDLVLVLSRKSQGLYVCVGQNDLGSANSTLIVSLQESVKRKSSSRDESALTHNAPASTILVFDFTAVQFTALNKIEWKKDRQILEVGSHKFFYEINLSGLVTLFISKISAADSGIYTCILHDNKGNKFEISLKLEVKKWPEEPTIVEASAVCNEGLLVVAKTTTNCQNCRYVFELLAYDTKTKNVTLHSTKKLRVGIYLHTIKNICNLSHWVWRISAWVKNRLGRSRVNFANAPVQLQANGSIMYRSSNESNFKNLQFVREANFQVRITSKQQECYKDLDTFKQNVSDFMEEAVRKVIPKNTFTFTNHHLEGTLYSAKISPRHLNAFLTSRKALSQELTAQNLSIAYCHYSVSLDCDLIYLKNVFSTCNSQVNSAAQYPVARERTAVLGLTAVLWRALS